MKCDLVLITPMLSFGALYREEVTPAEAYKIQVTDWILRPVKALEKSRHRTSNGMAAFAVLLMFFEPHGQYLLGVDSHGKSRRCFRAGFERFMASLSREAKGDAPKADEVYRWARCGLFHSTRLDLRLLVDTVGCGKGIFTEQPSVDACLVNPWRMRRHLAIYLEQYCTEIEQDKNSKLHTHFSSTFGRLIGEAMQHFCGSRTERTE